MKYYVYFDAYGHARQIISAKDLADNYLNDPDEFLKAMCSPEWQAETRHATGHVGTLNFNNDKELKEYLDSLGDEITGFYKGQSDSRPYNF